MNEPSILARLWLAEYRARGVTPRLGPACAEVSNARRRSGAAPSSGRGHRGIAASFLAIALRAVEATVLASSHAMDLAELYARHAERFDRSRTRSLTERPYLEKATALAPPPAQVLDVGCGSGEPLARYFVENGYRVTGIDVVSEMLEMCRARFPDTTWRQIDMRRLDIPERFEIVIARDSFFHLKPDDQRRMFATFRNHTAPGGVLVFTSGLTEGEAIGGDLFGDALYHASLDTREYARLLDRHGYDVVLHRIQDPDCGGHTIWLARRRCADG
jgi:SAM-dependent methyltransferase